MAVTENIDGIVDCCKGCSRSKEGLQRLLEAVVNIGDA